LNIQEARQVHILLIEDDPETAAYVAKGLRAEGHVLDVADSGIEGLRLAADSEPDLLIVDRMLPGLEGIAVVKALRANGSRVPVLFLTALNAVADRVEGLEAGGDDYLAKPFSFAELNARINALARRPPLRDEAVEFTAGDLRLNRAKRRVFLAGKPVALQPREYQLLEYLMAHAGAVVTRAMLLREVWGFNFDPGTNIVETHICRLRGKIDRGDDSSLIQTIRGSGYRFNAE
jgi:two-component system OmpR family response regulator